MASDIRKLQDISEALEKGDTPKATVRDLLRWFGMYRRSWRNVGRIRSTLRKYNLATKPDFEFAWVDGSVTFIRPEPKKSPSPPLTPAGQAAQTLPLLGGDKDPAYRIGQLDPANITPVTIAPDKLLAEAITVMLQNDFSQLPVMVSEREVKGVISWKSIGMRLALEAKCEAVRDCMETPLIISPETSIFEAAQSLVQHDYILVRAEDKRIAGIITASDMAMQFGKLGEPFLLIGEIENLLRMLLDGKYTLEDIQSVKNPGDDGRKIETIADLTFGEYQRLLQNPAMWGKLALNLDRVKFVEQLEKIRLIRNDVMHFDPDGIAEDDLEVLRSFTRFVQTVRKAMPDEESE